MQSLFMRRGAQGNLLLAQCAPRAASREDSSSLLNYKKYYRSV